MTTAHSRPDLAAYNDAARMTQSQLVTKLRALLGAKLVAYLGKVKEAERSASGPTVPAPSATTPTSNAYASLTAPRA